MAARIATVVTGQAAQYVGTNRASPPSTVPGSVTCRSFDGVSDRIVLGRSSDLGKNYLLLMTFWRLSATVLPNDNGAQRLFTQYAVGGTRVGVGINRDRLSLTYTDTTGALVTVESDVKAQDINRHFLGLHVYAGGISVYLDGRLAIKAAASLADPDTARAVVGADTARRFFAGFIDDLAIYQNVPQYTDNWLRFYRNMAVGAFSRDYVATGFAAGVNQAAVATDGYSATGAASDGSSRVALATSFRTESVLGDQVVEFVVGVGEGDLRIGVYSTQHDFSLNNIGDTTASFAWNAAGELLNNGQPIASGLPAWSNSPTIALVWTPTTRRLALWVGGQFSHDYLLPVGTWTAAVALGTHSVKLNAGHACLLSMPADSNPLPSIVRSKLTSELRHLRLGELGAPLDDADTLVRDARTGATFGEYISPLPLEGTFTGDPFDKSRRVGGGIRITAGAHTQADTGGFFFAVALSPTTNDLTGEKIILESPDRWGLKLLDGKLYGWCGTVQVGATGVSLVAGGRYYLGLSLSPTGKLLIWAHVGYILESGDPITDQTQGDVWVGSGLSGINPFEGQLSHLVLSSKNVPSWKQTRLKTIYSWDAPSVDGLTPSAGTINPPSIRKVFEVGYRDVLANGWAGLAEMAACYVSAFAVPPDGTITGFRMLSKAGATPFVGDDIRAAVPYGTLDQGLSKYGQDFLLAGGGADVMAQVVAGDTVLIGDELCRLVNIDPSGVFTVARGCADTLPAEHGAGSQVFFYRATWPTDPTLLRPAETYLEDGTVSIKLLSQSPAGETSEGFAPTDTLHVIGRRARPYPPEDIRINGDDENSGLFLAADPNSPNYSGNLMVSWSHRDKVAQGSSLVAFRETAASVAPSGVTYVVRFYGPDGALLHESAALDNTTSSYNFLDETFGPGRISVTVTSYEGGRACWQVPSVVLDYQGFVPTVMATENDEAWELEDGNVYATEDRTRARASNPNGEDPDYWVQDPVAEQSVLAGDILGVKVSEMPSLPAVSADAEIPVLKGGINYKETVGSLLQYVIDSLPPPVPGKSAYELAQDTGFQGTLAEWQASQVGPEGPSTNQARRIYTISNASGAIVCNWANYDEIRIRLVGNVTLTFQGAVDGQGCLLKIAQDATGGRTCTLPGNVRYNALIRQYTASPTAGLVDKVGFIYDSADSSYDFVSLVPGISAV